MKTLKLYFEQPGVTKPEIHRLATPEVTLQSYKALCDKAASLFPSLNGKKYVLNWIDDEDDEITISNDEELIHAMASQPDMKKITIRIIEENNNYSAQNHNDQESSYAGDIHPNVICDGCNGKVQGYRYKCLQCENYDLCSRCNNLDRHKGHDMLKMASPALYPHQWLFPGCARLWRSMFGHPCPRFTEGHKRFGRKNCGEEQRKKASERCREKKGYGKGDKWNNAQFLRSVGQTVASLLDPFGVQVEVDVVPSDSEPEASDNEYKKQSETQYEKKQKDVKEEQKKSETQPEKKQKEMKEEQKKPETENEKETEKEKSVEKVDVKDDATSENTEPKVAASSNNNADAGYSSATGNTPSFQGVRSKEVPFAPPLFPTQLLDWTHPKLPADVVKDNSSKKSSPADTESSCVADGWTVVGAVGSENANNDKKSTPNSENTPLYPPVVDLNLTEAINEVANCIKSTLKQANITTDTSSSSRTARSEETSKPMDPKIANALSKMIAMGFTNEGGWLARLLETKKGNINEAIDALYPNSSGRH